PASRHFWLRRESRSSIIGIHESADHFILILRIRHHTLREVIKTIPSWILQSDQRKRRMLFPFSFFPLGRQPLLLLLNGHTFLLRLKELQPPTTRFPGFGPPRPVNGPVRARHHVIKIVQGGRVVALPPFNFRLSLLWVLLRFGDQAMPLNFCNIGN